MAKRHMSIIDASKTLISKENAKLPLRCRLENYSSWTKRDGNGVR